MALTAAGKTARIKFVQDPHGMAAIGTTPEMAAFLQLAADEIAVAASQAAPVGPPTPGELASSIEAEVVEEGGLLIGRVTAMDFKGGWQEFGTVKMAPNSYLFPALQAVMAGAIITKGTGARGGALA